jgi:hypothetical protein
MILRDFEVRDVLPISTHLSASTYIVSPLSRPLLTHLLTTSSSHIPILSAAPSTETCCSILSDMARPPCEF